MIDQAGPVRFRHRLHRLAAMRTAAAGLMNRDHLGRDVFRRGAPEGLVVDVRRGKPIVDLYDLVAAFARVNARVDWSHPMLQDPLGG